MAIHGSPSCYERISLKINELSKKLNEPIIMVAKAAAGAALQSELRLKEREELEKEIYSAISPLITVRAAIYGYEAMRNGLKYLTCCNRSRPAETSTAPETKQPTSLKHKMS